MSRLIRSGFVNAPNQTAETTSWRQYLSTVYEGIVGRSLYEIQLREWFQAIRDVGRDPRTEVFVVRTEDMEQDVQGTMKKVYAFLGLPYVAVENEAVKVKGTYEPMKNETREMLEEFFEPYNKRLYDMLEQNGFGSDWQGYWEKRR